MADPLRVVVLKPSKYTSDGLVERFRRGFMPNSTAPYLRSMTPDQVDDTPIEIHSIDEYVHTDLDYLRLLHPPRRGRTLLALVGVQSHQFHRALDLAALALRNGCLAVIGGPHAMTCDTSMLQGRGISFALAEAERVWPAILRDAIEGRLQPTYGDDSRWQQGLDAPIVQPPDRRDLKRYIAPLLGLYPARGCPFTCNFCSVIKIAGRRIRSQAIDTTMASLREAKAAGVSSVMFTSDNFNKYPEAPELLEAIAREQLGLTLFVQCDTQVARQAELVEQMGRAGVAQMFVGVESFSRATLLAAKKGQNRPETYREIVRLCREHGIKSHFSNIIGFPGDGEAEVLEHLDTLRGLDPTFASFYVLCPIPGTEQYDEFLADGRIVEPNLDRFDTTCLTWRHPRLSAERLSELLFRCYRDFSTARHALRQAAGLGLLRRRAPSDSMGIAFMTAFNRYSAWRRTHPMSGGVGRVRRDRLDDFLPLRRATFGFDLAPLPRSLSLPEADEALNLIGASGGLASASRGRGRKPAGA